MPETYQIRANQLLSGTLRDQILAGLNITLRQNILDDAFAESGETETTVFNINKPNIIHLYSKEERNTYPAADITFVKFGTSIDLPIILWKALKNQIVKKVKLGYDLVESKEFDCFFGEVIAGIISDRKYAPVNKIESKYNGSANSIVEEHVMARVFLVSRVLLKKGGNKILNLSPYLMSCTTSVTKTGGSFSITLPPIVGSNDANSWLDATDKKNMHVGKGGFLSEGLMHWFGKRVILKAKSKRPEDEAGVNEGNKTILPADNIPYRWSYHFASVINPQDLVFIKFEPLQSEVGDKTKSAEELDPFRNFTTEDLKNGFFDMIGLVDDVSESFNGGSADVSIDVSGRDLVKCIIDDGTYIFPNSVVDTVAESNYFPNTTPDSRAVERIFGEIKDLIFFTNKPIKDILSYVLQKMQTVEIFPNDLFSFVQNPRANAQGIWNMVDMVIDPEVAGRIIIDSGLAQNSGSIRSYIDRLVQEPFIEFFTDTYKDKFYWIVRKPPFTYQSIMSNWNEHMITIDDTMVESTKLMSDAEESHSWYRIQPLGYYLGESNYFNDYIFPAVFFTEYAEVFGAQSKDIVSNYVSYGYSDAEQGVGYKQAVLDLEFLIETNAYLPFTRRGSITIHRDRRIKRGMWIYFASNDEVFYVDGVSHSYQISRGKVATQTVLTVVRGMSRTHLAKYFQLINFNKTKDASGAEVAGDLRTWKVNRAIFNFLLERKQDCF